MSDHAPSGVRLADLLGTLSLAVDLGLGQPIGHVARAATVADRLAGVLGLPAEERETLCQVSLLGWLGCIADSHQAAQWFGDDIEYRGGVYDLDMRPLPFLGYLLRHTGPDKSPLRRTGMRAALVLDRGRSAEESLRSHCQVTAQMADRIGLDEPVCDALDKVFARWDGKGLPAGLGGTDIPVCLRLWHLADVAEVHHRRGGTAAAVAVVRARTGTEFDPGLAAVLCEHAADLLADLDDVDLVDRSSLPTRVLTEAELDRVLAAVADWVDLKSPWFAGHSGRVAALAGDAAAASGLPAEEVRLVRRAAWLHDLGRVGVSNALWDKPGALTGPERERIRLHSYYTERMLVGTEALAGYAPIAAAAHERLDGSGYHRGSTAAALSRPARILAAADAFRTKREARPHRPSLDAPGAAAHLDREVAEGRLDKLACDAVLECAHQPRTTAPHPAGLTHREAEVLSLLARGLTNREVARALRISPKTVGNHVEHVYTKAGVGTRAAASLFAMQHGLVDVSAGPGQPPRGAP